MPSIEHVRDVWISPIEVKYCMSQAKLAEIGGQSHVRKSKDRQGILKVDQIVGQFGQYALSIYLFGRPDQYYTQRMVANLHPEVGDQGQDIVGLNVDCKTSLMRNSKNPMDYHLLVRPKEKHPGWCYFHALVLPNGESSLDPKKNLLIRLTGWANENELPKAPETDGIFKGAYKLEVAKLNPLPNMMWAWRLGMFS